MDFLPTGGLDAEAPAASHPQPPAVATSSAFISADMQPHYNMQPPPDTMSDPSGLYRTLKHHPSSSAAMQTQTKSVTCFAVKMSAPAGLLILSPAAPSRRRQTSRSSAACSRSQGVGRRARRDGCTGHICTPTQLPGFCLE